MLNLPPLLLRFCGVLHLNLFLQKCYIMQKSPKSYSQNEFELHLCTNGVGVGFDAFTLTFGFWFLVLGIFFQRHCCSSLFLPIEKRRGRGGVQGEEAGIVFSL